MPKRLARQVATDAADALLKAVDDPPDLLICDYRMPGMDGRQLVEKLRSRPRTAGAGVILVATKADISEKLSTPDLPVDDFVEKPFFLREATQRIKRVIDKIALEKMAKTVPSDGVLRGSLLQMNVIDLVQSLEMGQKSCRLQVQKAGQQCELYFTSGQCRDAKMGALEGDDAVYKIVLWTEGEFEIDFNAANASQRATTTRSTTGLLMEAMRLIDEATDPGE